MFDNIVTNVIPHIYGNTSEIVISVCMLSNSRTELIFGPSIVRMYRTVLGKYILKSNWDNAKFTFKPLFNEFVICFAVVVVFVLNVIFLLIVTILFIYWRGHVLSSRVCSLECLCQ